MNFSSLKNKKTPVFEISVIHWDPDTFSVASLAPVLVLSMVIITAAAQNFWLNERSKYMQQNYEGYSS